MFRLVVVLLLIAFSFALPGYCQFPDDLPIDSPSLIQLLQSDSEVFVKAKACQRLAVVGDNEAVKALANLVDHPQLSGYAIGGLLQIPGENADAALIRKLEETDQSARIALIDALGQRGVDAAVTKLAALLTADSGEAQQRAILRALGSIGGKQVDAILNDAGDYPEGSPLAIALHDARLRLQKESLGAGSSDVKELEILLQQGDKSFQSAMRLARQIGPAAAPVVARKLSTFDDSSHEAVSLILLRDLGDRGTLPMLTPSLASQNDEVAFRAYQAAVALGGLVDWEAIALALRERPDLARQLAADFANAENQKFDQQIESSLAAWAKSGVAPDGPELGIAMIEYAAQRRLSSVTPHLIQLSSQGEEQTRASALSAAALTVATDQFSALLDRVLGEPGLSKEMADAAMQNALVHLPQNEAASAIGSALKGASDSQRGFLMSQLAFLGGPEALRIVVDSVTSGEDATVDTATQVLGQWRTADVAEPLLELAKTLSPGKYQLRALRGYLRVGRQLDLPIEQRMTLCRNGLELAQRDEERQLVLEILARYPDKSGMELLLEWMPRAEMSAKAIQARCYAVLVRQAERISLHDRGWVVDRLKTISDADVPASVWEKLSPYHE